MEKIEKLKMRFFQRIQRTESGCWLWTGSVHKGGYGRIKLRHDVYGVAHRVAWELLRGPIPPGLTIDHLCFVKRCVNPEDLEPCTTQENTRRYYAAYPVVRAPKPPRRKPALCAHDATKKRRECRDCTLAYHRDWYFKSTEGKVKRRYPNTKYSVARELARKQADESSIAPRGNPL